MRVLSPSPTRSNSGYPRVFRSRPQFHGCEGVSGKLGGAPGAAYKTGWARAQVLRILDSGASNRLWFSPAKWPGNAPNLGAYLRAYLRAHWRAISRLERAIPQSIAGPI
jgi:hypothetical protein